MAKNRIKDKGSSPLLSKEFKKIQFEISSQNSDIRLDKALSFFPDIATRSQASHLIRQSLVSLRGQEGETLKPSKKTLLGEIYTVFLPLKDEVSLKAFPIPIDIVMEDEHILVVNKPSGLVVHPALGHEEDSLVNALIHHKKKLYQGFGQKNRPGIVHRLDKDTSGLLVVAKTKQSHDYLSCQFKERKVQRTYLALVFGLLDFQEGGFVSTIVRHPFHRKKFMTKEFLHFKGSSEKYLKYLKDEFNKEFQEKLPIHGKRKKTEKESPSPFSLNRVSGKWALTRYKEKEHYLTEVSFVECHLETGRTHQIRVHFSKAGHPLIGDTLYGKKRGSKKISSLKLRQAILSLDRVALHASELAFHHPIDNKPLSFKAPLPDNLLPLFQLLNFHSSFI